MACNTLKLKGSQFAYDLLISLCSCLNVKLFEKIYQDFAPLKYYTSSCFKIVNKHCLRYLELRERHYLKQRREKGFDKKRFELIWLCPKKLEPYLELTTVT